MLLSRRTTPLALLCLSGCYAQAPSPSPDAGVPADASAETARDSESAPLAAPALVGDVTRAELGAPAPDFLLADSDGQTHRLSDFRGRPVVLEWINHSCPYVVRVYGDGTMQALQERYTGDDVVWLSMASSGPGKQGHMSPADWTAASSDKGSAATAVLIDETGVVGRAYGARTTPHMFVVDAEGQLVYSGALDDDPRGRSDAPTNFVAETLDRLLEGNEVEPRSTDPYGCGIKFAN
jgi:hypothetical protein